MHGDLDEDEAWNTHLLSNLFKRNVSYDSKHAQEHFLNHFLTFLQFVLQVIGNVKLTRKETPSWRLVVWGERDFDSAHCVGVKNVNNTYL